MATSKSVGDKATPKDKIAEQRKRTPMSLPTQRLEVPEIPGYHLHWMNGSKQRIAQALQAGYQFVNIDEVDASHASLGSAIGSIGSTDLGSRVSVSAGSGVDPDGSEVRLYLMKIQEEFWNDDQKKLEERNEQIAAALRGGNSTETNPHGVENRYIPEGSRATMRNLFTPKRRSS